MNKFENPSVPADFVARDEVRCIRPAADLRQVSWAMSYPNAALEEHFRSLLTHELSCNGLKQCA